MFTHGTWSLKSSSDPRWNTQGIGAVGDFEIPALAKDAIEVLKNKLGCDPPKDLEYFYMKD